MVNPAAMGAARDENVPRGRPTEPRLRLRSCWYERCSRARVALPLTSSAARSLRSVLFASFGLALVGASCDIEDPTQAAPVPEEDFGPAPPQKSRLELLARLGRKPQFLVGHGNDLPGADKGFDFAQAGIYTLPATLDVHYVYLSGLHDEMGPDGPGWPEYNPDGSFVTKVAENALARGIVPMFTLYQAAARGEKRLDLFSETDFMTKYWFGVRLLFERLAQLDQPAMVHLEPDFWGFAQQASLRTLQPADLPVVVGALVPECSGLPADVGGMGRCIVRLARAIAPKVALGLHASGFGFRDNPKRVAKYLGECGALESDFVVVDMLDRDAGCFEADLDPNCRRAGFFPYWDETNKRSPNFEEHLTWAGTLHERLGLPVLWWQLPLGVPSDTPGGTPKRYRDNRVRYFFEHPSEFEAAGGFGAVFGVGAPNQTDITTDDGQFARAVTRYFGAPFGLPRP